MMFTHIVLFLLKEPNGENQTRAEQILLSMKGQIAELKSLEVGKNSIDSGNAYDVALIARFDTREDYERYAVHPFHVEQVLAKLKPMLRGKATADYEDVGNPAQG